MGKKFLHHKVEMFDAFVITVSWILDVAFWEGLWAHPEEEAANIMIFILPWRVMRIVNSEYTIYIPKTCNAVGLRYLKFICR